LRGPYPFVSGNHDGQAWGIAEAVHGKRVGEWL
jgi:hypothetical protein